MKKTIMTAILVLLVVLGGWFLWSNRQQPVETEEEGIAWYQNDSLLWAQLGEAIEDAKQLDSTKISNQLMPIKKDYPGQEWANFDGKDMVLLVTLVDSSRLARFFGRDDVYQIDRELGTWASLPLDWKNRAAEYEGLDSIGAHMRMVQMYGLSPDCDYNIMVQFYADPAGIFRPSHDPDITTTSTSLEFPAYADENYKVGETNFREWYRLSVYSAYEDDTPLPWTQLGYTYDWHKGAASYVGVSEYIVTHHTWIKVKSHESEWEFIQNLSK